MGRVPETTPARLSKLEREAEKLLVTLRMGDTDSYVWWQALDEITREIANWAPNPNCGPEWSL